MRLFQLCRLEGVLKHRQQQEDYAFRISPSRAAGPKSKWKKVKMLRLAQRLVTVL
jgi:hypothetical protein